MGFGNNEYNNSNDNPWGGSGFNADDYMQNLEKLSPTSNLTLGIKEGMRGDFNNAQNQWKDTMGAYKNYYDRTQEWGGLVKDYWDQYEEGAGQRNERQQQAINEYDDRVSNIGQDYRNQTNRYAKKLNAITNQGASRASLFAGQASEKYAQLESELTDYSQQAVSAQIQGETQRMKSQTQMQKEQARRQGAPQSVLDQIDYEGDRALDQGLQQGIANAQMGWQQLTQEAGSRYAQSLANQGDLETQLTGLKAQSAGVGLDAQLQGSQFASQMDMTGAEAQKNLAMSITSQEEIRKKERMMSELQAEQVGIAGMLDYAEAIRNNPAVSAASVYSSMLALVTMPNYESSASHKYMPGEAPNRLEGYRKEAIERGLPAEDWTDADLEKYKNPPTWYEAGSRWPKRGRVRGFNV